MSSSSKMILIKTSDGETFELEESVALQSKTIEHMIEDGCAGSVIPTPNITGKILSKVIEYCTKHAETSKNKVTAEDLEEFDAEFVKVDQPTLFGIILAANYLNIQTLLKLTCKTVADMARGKTVQEIRNHFNIRNDLTPEEEEQIRLENAWAFDSVDKETTPAEDEQAQDGQAQDGQAQDGQAQDGQAQNGQAQNGQAQNGQVQNGQAQNGQAQNGQAQNGQAQNGQAQNGQAQGGQAQDGQAQA